MTDEARVLQVALEILGYLVRHPEAADTREHISNWWLGSRDVEPGWDGVTSALEMLEKNGHIEHVELPNRRIAYRLRSNAPHPPQNREQG